MKYSEALLERASKVRCMITDLDGVLTDGRLYIDQHGNEHKAYHVQDGMGLKLLMAAGISVAVITTARAHVVMYRMKQLGITHCFTGQVEKLTAFNELKKTLGIEDNSAFAYIGDDLPDLPILQKVGLSVAVADAVSEVQECAYWKTMRNGGAGAVRELCDIILHAQNLKEQALEKYFAAPTQST